MRLSGFKLGKIFGIEIFIDYSWFIVFFLITWLLSTRYFPSFFSQSPLWVNWSLGSATSLFFFLSALTHELSHSVMAQRSGIKVNKITLFIFGGVAELFDEPQKPIDELKIASIGPFISIILALIFWLIYLIFRDLKMPELSLLFSTLSQINALLAFFNLLPGFPLDGGRILRSIVWRINGNLLKSTLIASNSGRMIAILIIIFGSLRIFTTDIIGGVWLILIGLFLYQAAGQAYLELLIRIALQKVKIKEIMNRNVIQVSPYLSVNELIEEFFLKYNLNSLPVISNNQIVGIVSLKSIRSMSKEINLNTKIYEVMDKVQFDLFLKPEDEAIDALKLMIKNNINFVTIREDNQLIGILTIDDVTKYLTEQKVI